MVLDASKAHLLRTEAPQRTEDRRRKVDSLGLSPRTLHRRLRHLMDLAGVRTRMQLGGHAVRHGWVEPHPARPDPA
ncbi:hypothetical protein ABZS83_10405 [Streptomyces sp. NPDC005426]|uniref:hypothetical protein n=1 Tax=Streptomyces sp. NPDC005426 TaxID=3155344 RepID=UPI0033A2034D